MKPHNLLNNLSPRAVGLFLFCLLVFIRLPFFFRDYIDRDESTFILMGQSIADGYLPYDQLWDLKPPLLFYIFGGVETIFPDSLIAIRITGLLFIFGSCLLLHHIALRGRLKNPSLIPIVYAILSSMFGSMQGVMSEHIAVFFLLAALYLFLSKRTVAHLFFAGVLFGCSMLCKLNFAYAVMAVLVYRFITSRFDGLWLPFRNLVITGIGITVSFLLAALPFILHGKMNLFIDSVFLATYEYGHDTSISFLDKIRKTWWIILISIATSGWALNRMTKENSELTWISILILLATVFTFFSAGVVNGHYLVQVYPFLAILVAGVIAGKDLRIGLYTATLAILLMSAETWQEYYRVGKHLVATGKWYNGSTFDVISELKKRNLADDKLFFVDYHIGYWMLGKQPLTKSTTHPSNITRPYLFKYIGNRNSTTMQELKLIFESMKPGVVISKNNYLSFFRPESEENIYFQEIMAAEFEQIVADTKKRIYIWQRKTNKY